MSQQTVGFIASQIAEDIGLCWPRDSERIFKNLTHVQNEIWTSGKFYGSTQFWDCKVSPTNQLITPHGYGILLGIDINGKPKDIKDEFFLFHKNGPGDIAEYRGKCKTFNDNVMSLGESPVLMQPTDESCRQRRMDCNPKRILVKSECGASDPPFPKTRVSGLGADGMPIYSYMAVDPSTEEESLCQCKANEAEQFKAIQGIEYHIAEVSTVADIRFSKINNIIKEPTLGPVEYYMVNEDGVGTLIARMEPWQLLSSYKIYQLPRQCKQRSVLGLFKRNKPEPIIDENQIFISSDMEAILSIAIAVDFKFSKKNIAASVGYFQAGAISLNADLKENRTGAQQTMQIDNKQGYQDFPKM